MGGGPSRPAPKAEPKPEPQKPPEPEKPTRSAREEAGAMRARRRRGGGMRSLLSPTRQDAVGGLSDKLSGQ
jgi:hypothetical protein